MTTIQQKFMALQRPFPPVKFRNGGSGFTTHCPGHDDHSASLDWELKDGKIVGICRSHGCDIGEVLAKKGLNWDAILEDRIPAKKAKVKSQNWGPITATWLYQNAEGNQFGKVERYDPTDGKKQFIPSYWTEKGWVRAKKGPHPWPLYRADKLAHLAPGSLVCLAEGEKCVDRLVDLGFEATTHEGGSQNWDANKAGALAYLHVVVFEDNDEPGAKLVAQQVESLLPVAASVRVVRFAGTAKGYDVADYINEGHTAEDIRRLIDAAPVIVPPKPENGAELLDDVSQFLGRFVAYPNQRSQIAHTLWIAHTHLMDMWDSTPRIAFLSPEPGSGKTRALEVSELLVPRPVEAVNMSAAALFRKVADDAGLPTILLDECDTVFGTKRAAETNEDVRGLLNAGHRRGAKSYRCVTRGREIEVVEYEAFSAVALAGLGDLPDTILARSIIVKMRRRAPNERVEPFRRRMQQKRGHELRDRLDKWAQSIANTVADPWPEMPAGIEDRDADIWEALIAIADAAGEHWPATAREAAVSLVTESKETTPSLGIKLLTDLRTIFGESDALFTDAILLKLHAIEESPWAEILQGKPLNTRGLAKRLTQYGIKSKTVRVGPNTAKGYTRADLYDAWLRYLPSPEKSDTTVTNVTTDENPSNHAGFDVTDSEGDNVTETSQPPEYVTSRRSFWDDVTDVTDVTDSMGNGEKRCSECGRPLEPGQSTLCLSCVDALYERAHQEDVPA